MKSYRIAFINTAGLTDIYVTSAMSRNLAIDNLKRDYPHIDRPVSAGTPEVNPIISITCKL